MKKKPIIAAAAVGIAVFAGVRTAVIIRAEKAPETAVRCGKYYLDNGQKNAYIEIISAAGNGRSFVMSVNNYDLTEMTEHIMSTYGEVRIGDLLLDEKGEPIRGENREFLFVETETQRAELQRKKEAELRQIIDDFLTAAEHGYELTDYGYDGALGWYQYSLKDCGGYFDLRVSPEKAVINFDEYLWKYEK